MFGYYIEISKSNLHAVPADYMRKQTIAGGERFITPALKEYEEKVLGADERIAEREIAHLRAAARAGGGRGAPYPGHGPRDRRTRHARRVLRSRHLGNYTKPHVHEGDELLVVDGRHPVVERTCLDAFVPNDIR